MTSTSASPRMRPLPSTTEEIAAAVVILLVAPTCSARRCRGGTTDDEIRCDAALHNRPQRHAPHLAAVPLLEQRNNEKEEKEKESPARQPAMKNKAIPEICHQDENPDNEIFCQPLTGSDRSKKVGWNSRTRMCRTPRQTPSSRPEERT